MKVRSARAVLIAAVLACSALFGAVPASADQADDARAAATQFLDALARGDAPTACSLFTPATLERIGGGERCREMFSDRESVDEAAFETLLRAHRAARRSADRRKAGYVTKKFRAAALARAMERIDPELTVKLARRPTAAAGQLVTTAILDTRTTARRIVLYAESDDGSILRLTASRRGRPRISEVAQGTPEAGPPAPREPAFRFTIDTVTLAGTTAYVRATLRPTEVEESPPAIPLLLELVPGPSGAYLVQEMFIAAFPGAPGR